LNPVANDEHVRIFILREVFMELNPEIDLIINTADISSEFRSFSIVFYRYCEKKADIEKQRDIAKAKLKEVKAVVYKQIKNNVMVKHTEKSIEAEIDSHPIVLEAQNKLIEAEHDASTIGCAVESMKAKKDMLIQIGSDRRKEI
jgi:cell fate (sporulation/competence/biofilm development) regulator YmcA (YheA/YmcA/DUF963 family)